jgi:uncharacterized protein
MHLFQNNNGKISHPPQPIRKDTPTLSCKSRDLSAALILLSAFTFLTSCAPKVQLSTPEPLKVDIDMTVNVYQREIASQTKKVSEEELQALRRAEGRAGEIWAMKNDGVIIETETGYLQSQNRSGWDPVYVNRIVAEENRDRRIKYEAEARDTQVPIETVQALAGKRLREQAYVTRTNTVQSVTVPTVPKTK